VSPLPAIFTVYPFTHYFTAFLHTPRVSSTGTGALTCGTGLGLASLGLRAAEDWAREPAVLTRISRIVGHSEGLSGSSSFGLSLYGATSHHAGGTTLACRQLWSLDRGFRLHLSVAVHHRSATLSTRILQRLQHHSTAAPFQVPVVLQNVFILHPRSIVPVAMVALSFQLSVYDPATFMIAAAWLAQLPSSARIPAAQLLHTRGFSALADLGCCARSIECCSCHAQAFSIISPSALGPWGQASSGICPLRSTSFRRACRPSPALRAHHHRRRRRRRPDRRHRHDPQFRNTPCMVDMHVATVATVVATVPTLVTTITSSSSSSSVPFIAVAVARSAVAPCSQPPHHQHPRVGLPSSNSPAFAPCQEHVTSPASSYRTSFL